MILGIGDVVAEALFSGAEETALRARLKGRWLAGRASNWLKKAAEDRHTKVVPPQSLIVWGPSSGRKALLGSCSFSTEGLGITPGAEFGIVQVSETVQEAETFGTWFETHWNGLDAGPHSGGHLVDLLDDAASQRLPSLLYFQMLYQLCKELGDELDEERIIKSATGIRNAVVWNKLFRFQRDSVVGAIDKRERIGGCIIADSVGLGKTFEALAVIKYYELRTHLADFLAANNFARRLKTLGGLTPYENICKDWT